MIRRNQEFLNRVNVLLDFLVIITAYVLATWFWLDVMGGHDDNMAALSGRTLGISCIYALVLIFLLSLFGFYGTTRTKRLGWKLQIIFITTSVTVLMASTLLFIFRLADFSRGVLFSFSTNAFILYT